jgi:hypothetical protein
MLLSKSPAIILLIATMATCRAAVAVETNAMLSIASNAATIDYARTGKQLRREIKDVFANLKKTRALGTPTKGNDITDVVLKYIPVGATFQAAESILRAAGCKVDIHPTDIPNLNRPLEPQTPVLAKLILGGWPLAHYLLVSLVPRTNGDYSVVTGLSATILVSYS